MDALEILRAASHPVFVCDERDLILEANATARELLGAVRSEIVGRPFHDVAGFRDVFGNRVCTNGCSLHQMVNRGEPIQAHDLDLPTPAGDTVRVRISVVVLMGPQPGSYRMVYHVSPAAAPVAVGPPAPQAAALPTNGKGSDVPHLTRRERQILTRLVEGERAREISQSLGIRVNTLRSHTQNILRKLGARSKVEAVSLALRQNLI
jgi:DNA-binding CsgD family transcriptional regulator